MKHTRTIPSPEEMAAQLLAAGWTSWEQTVTFWQTPDGSAIFGTRSAWEIMTRDRAARFDS